jgi:CBS domain-containing protein
MDLARNLKIESVSRLHPTPPHRLAPSQTVAEAVELLRRQDVGCVLICEGESLVGVFTERDLLRRILALGKPLSMPLSACMSLNPVTAQTKDSIGSAVRKMEEGGYRHLPVLDETGQPVGILSVRRIVHYLVEHFPATVYNLPPDPGAVEQCREREGA